MTRTRNPRLVALAALREIKRTVRSAMYPWEANGSVYLEPHERTGPEYLRPREPHEWPEHSPEEWANLTAWLAHVEAQVAELRQFAAEQYQQASAVRNQG